MFQVRVYKTSGEVELKEDDFTSITFGTNGSDDKGEYFYANAVNIGDAFELAINGIQAVKATLQASITSLDSMLAGVDLNKAIVFAQLQANEVAKETTEE